MSQAVKKIEKVNKIHLKYNKKEKLKN